MSIARYALFGHPVAHSQSPVIQRAFAAQTGIACSYELIDTPPGALRAALTEFFAHGGQGVNITLPYKQDVVQLCTRLSERARIVQDTLELPFARSPACAMCRWWRARRWRGKHPAPGCRW